MQFEHPALLWALFLLLIPIIVHLFQLRRFKKTPFTNVAMLQKVVSESRKSSTLKKWLLLFARLGLLTALVLAFAKPFASKKTALAPKETVVYLDNSFSMQAQKEGTPLFEKAIQDLIKNFNGDAQFSLITNNSTYANITISDNKNELLAIEPTAQQLSINDVLLKAGTLFSKNSGTVQNLVLISDFQETMGPIPDSIPVQNLFAVTLRPERRSNVSIDSIYIESGNGLSQSDLSIYLSGNHEEENLPIALYDNDTLIAKTSATLDQTASTAVVFSIPSGEDIKGRVEITDGGLPYDNRFFFTIGKPEKIKVLVVSDNNTDYLRRIYTEDEFSLTSVRPDQLDYSLIEKQNTVVIDGLAQIPQSLSEVLKDFMANDGNLIFIPSKEGNLGSYNQMLSFFGAPRFLEWADAPTNVSNINFGHPILVNVFERQVTNFQYPKVEGHYRVNNAGNTILGYDGNEPFLYQKDNLYVFSAPLLSENTNFKGSPLIVPVFYNISLASLQNPRLYEVLGQPTQVDLPVQTGQDNILKLSLDGKEFIPRQRSFANKTTLFFDSNPYFAGTYAITNGQQKVGRISFNYPRTESRLAYQELIGANISEQTENLEDAFEILNAQNQMTSYWKWFVILALVFALMEMFIQKLIS